MPKLADPLLPVSSETDFSSAAQEGPKQQLSPSRIDGASGSRNTSDYLFVSNVRFVAMISIVWVHSMLRWGVAPSPSSYIQVALLQLMKFGTIGFFLISGYLLGEGLTRTTPLQYFYRRVRAVFVPWAFWSFVWFVIALSQDLLDSANHQHLESSLRDLGQMYLKFVFTQSIYWFVPNFFLGLAIVLGLYRKVPDYVQGPVFLAFSLFYGINAYIKVIPVVHMSAVFGFVFYLWLGSFAYHHRDSWNRWMAKISWGQLAICIGVAAVSAFAELHMLRKLHSEDSYNTLRISNQIFSVGVTLLIVKCKHALFPKRIDVRSETFGIFLIHPILIEVFQVANARIPVSVRDGIAANGPLLLILGVATFAVLYLLSLLLTKQIRRVSLLRWMVGR